MVFHRHPAPAEGGIGVSLSTRAKGRESVCCGLPLVKSHVATTTWLSLSLTLSLSLSLSF